MCCYCCAACGGWLDLRDCGVMSVEVWPGEVALVRGRGSLGGLGRYLPGLLLLEIVL